MDFATGFQKIRIVFAN